MKVRDLIEQLEDCNPNATIFIAYQPNYPLCGRTGGNIVQSECKDRVYIAEWKNGNEYLPEGISEKFINW